MCFYGRLGAERGRVMREWAQVFSGREQALETIEAVVPAGLHLMAGRTNSKQQATLK